MDEKQDGPEHPEALLAGYVDGSATPDERARAEDHLAACATCRDDVRLARSAYQALRVLPEVEPSIAAAEVTTGGAPASADVVDIRSRRRRRVMGGAGLAAAAAIVAVFVAIVSGGTSSRESAGTSSPTRGAPQIMAPGAVPSQSVTSSELAELARVLAGQNAALGSEASSPHASVTAAPGASGVFRSAFAPGSRVSCAAPAAGLPNDTDQVYAQPVILDGVSAWAVGYRIPGQNGGSAHVVLVAVAQSDCRVLYLARVVAAP